MSPDPSKPLETGCQHGKIGLFRAGYFCVRRYPDQMINLIPHNALHLAVISRAIPSRGRKIRLQEHLPAWVSRAMDLEECII